MIDAVEADARLETIEIRHEGDRRTLELTLELPRPELAKKQYEAGMAALNL